MRGRSWVCIVALGVVAEVAHATPVLDKPAFTATPAELQSVAKAAPRSSSDVVVLREDNNVSYDDRGRRTMRWRLVFVVATKAGANDWNTLSTTWHPAYQDTPKVRARVIDASGRSVDLDPSLVTDVPAGDAAQTQPGDRRRLEAPLPPLSVGAIVEEEVTTIDREPLPGGGGAYATRLGSSTSIAETRVTLSSPAGKKLAVAAYNLPSGTKPHTQTTGGRRTITYTIGALAPKDDYEGYVPGDARPYRYINASPVASWTAVAREYRALVDKRIAAGPFALPGELPKAATLDTVREIVGWVQRNVKYSGIELDDSSAVPSTPAEIVKRGRANALDTATLLAAMLRQARIPAELALVSVGPGPDVDRGVPALNVFDHALVRARVGTSVVWIDPIEQLVQPGRLPSHDQGRLALVIADSTRALVATPTSPGTANVIREVRTFELAEAGNAKITEVSREGGAFESEQRVWVRDNAAATVRESLTTYADREYKGKLASYTTTKPDDLTKPFEMTVVMEDAIRGYSGREAIDVYLFATDTLKKLPKVLTSPEEKQPVRKYAFVLPTPHVYEIESRLIVPAGFTVPSPAPDRTRELGPFKLVEKQRVDGRTLIVTFRLDATKSRLEPAEVTRLQQAMRALGQEDGLHIVIPHTGSSLADRGKYRDALAEVNKLIALHPKEALHHQQLAQVLIEAGAGAAARRAARKAVELEPKNADARVVLGWVLQHDSFGTWLGFDHDHKGAVAALQKAHKLDPQHIGAAADLAAALEHNAKGRRFEAGSDVRGAAAAWRKARALDDTTDHAYGLAVALIWAGEAAEAEKVLRGMRSEERRDQLLIVASALTAGADAAIRVAGTLGGGKTKTTNLAEAGGILMLLRHYDAMRALIGEARSMQPGTPQAQLVQRLARSAKPFKPANEPRDVVTEWFLSELTGGRKSNVCWDTKTRDELHEQMGKARRAYARSELMTSALIEDMVRGVAILTVAGTKDLWRVELDQFGKKAPVYVAANRGVVKVIGAPDAPQGAGRHVLRLLAKNDEANASRLLDWLAKDLAGGARTNRFAHDLTTLWGDKLPRTRHAMELAAAALTGTSDAARATPILEKCKPTTTEGQLVCDWALSDLYQTTRRWAELEEHGRQWAGRAPKQLGVPVAVQAAALVHVSRFDDADRVLTDGLAQFPGHRSFVYSHAEVAIARGNLAEAVKRLQPLAARTPVEPTDLNNLAWLELAEGSDLPGAEVRARKAVQLAADDASALNTLAAILAEVGELGEARQHLLKSMEVKGDERPDDADLYVHGRILEQLGLAQDALALYRLTKATQSTSFIPQSHDFAKRRMKALGVTK